MASPIAFLAGVWRGSGRGQFPTMDAFDYEEEVRFLDFGVPALMYQQHAWTAEDGDLLHFEAGIWRCSPAGQLAVSVALPRVTEIAEGTITDGQIRLVATSVRRASGGAGLVAVQREYDCSADEIRYRVAMATETVAEIKQHLSGRLRRAEPA